VTVAVEQGKGIVVIGSLRAVGAAGKSILFKGLSDTPGYWRGITFHSNSALNELGFMAVRDAGGVTPETSVRASIMLAGTTYSGAALKLYNSFVSSGAGYGLYVEGMSSVTCIETTFDHNEMAGAYIPAGQLHRVYDNTFYGNTFEGIETGGNVSTDSNITWRKITTGSYLVSSDIKIGSEVTIQPDAAWLIKDNITISIIDNGSLTAVGNQAAPITFSSASESGRWNGLLFKSANSNNYLEFVEVYRAGANRIDGSIHAANVVVGEEGILQVKRSTIVNSPGYGIAARRTNQLNDDVATTNTFASVALGKVFPTETGWPAKPPVAGLWLDWWSFNAGASALSNSFYNQQTGVWFGGVARPWDMPASGFGILIDENNRFTWTAAEHAPFNGCASFSAEYMIGIANITPTRILFDQEYWRSMFINGCDASQNVDTSVETSVVDLPYEINWHNGQAGGDGYWELKFRNPDASTFSYYRK
jgi:hypothetical protein